MYISVFDSDFWQEIWSSLKKNKLRTFLTSFGIFWGIFMLVVMAGAGQGLANGITEGFGNFATNSAFFWTQPTGEPYKGYKRGRLWDLTNDDMAYIKENVKELQYIAPRLQGWRQSNGDNTHYNNKSGSFYIKGDYPSYRNIDPFTVLKGRFINDIDIMEKRKVCIIGERVEEVLFDKDEDPVGKYIKVNGVWFQVVGVFTPDTQMNFGGDKKESVFIPFTTLQQTYNYGNEVHFFSITAKPGVPVSTVEDKVVKILKDRHDIAPNDKDGVGHVNVEMQFKQISMLFSGINILTWFVGIMTLFAGVIGVSNIMLVIVRERTHEIGIQRAIGATPAKIITQILSESIVLTTIAGYVGLFLAMMLLEGVSYGLEKAAENPDNTIVLQNPQISFGVGIASLIILIIGGALAGLLPAYRAVKMKAIDALRDE
ncbi:ABC transporter permease [Saccharicrinis sp. FJH54]|uniref:ABC transporter permease n=1 Tax=Saccharicrinis sp. FJH54 TaxID=3344665 RepID=UPI0035D50DE9